MTCFYQNPVFILNEGTYNDLLNKILPKYILTSGDISCQYFVMTAVLKI
jgi:hypothetical protein